MARLLTAALLAILLAAASAAQVPLPISSSSAEPYTLLHHSNSEFHMNLDAGPYWFVDAPSDPLPREYWIWQDGSQLMHADNPGFGGGGRFFLKNPGNVTIQANGSGTIAVVDGFFVDNIQRERESIARNSTGNHYAFALARSISPSHFCIRTESPFTWASFSHQHKPIATGSSDANGTVDYEFKTEGIFSLFFMELKSPGVLNATVQPDGCGDESPASEPPGATPVPVTGILPLVFAVLLAVFIHRRR